jgi:hypothetical protein
MELVNLSTYDIFMDNTTTLNADEDLVETALGLRMWTLFFFVHFNEILLDGQSTASGFDMGGIIKKNLA